jgi:hypothetical protein
MRTAHRIITLPALLLLAAGCQKAQMRLPEPLAGAERLTVEGRQGWRAQQRLRFGPYETSRVRRSWTRGRDREIVPVRQQRRQQRYDFVLREQGRDRWSVACDAWLLVADVRVAGATIEPVSTSELVCDLRSLDEDGRSWMLDLSETHERPLRGVLRRGRTELRVAGTDRLDRGLPIGETAGYHLSLDDRPLAAVETLNEGSVWLSRSLEPELRGVVSATAAALLLFEDLREGLPGAEPPSGGCP